MLHSIYAREVAALGLIDDAVLESALAIKLSEPSPEWGKAVATLLSPNMMQPEGSTRLREQLRAR